MCLNLSSFVGNKLNCILLVVVLSGCGDSQANKSTSPSPEPKSSAGQQQTGVDPPNSTVSDPSGDSSAKSNPSMEKSAPPEDEKPTAEQIARWAVPEFEPFRLLSCYDGFEERMLLCMAFTPDGKQFVTGGGRLLLWNTVDPTPAVDLLADHEGQYEPPVTSLAISNDGKWLAAGDAGGHLGIWNLEKPGEAVFIDACQGDVSQVAFSPNSEQIATTNYSGEVKLWQTSDGKPIKTLPLSEGEIKRLVFVSDNLLAGASDSVVIWNLENGEKVNVLTSGRLMGEGLAISPDKKQLAFSGENGISIWDIGKSAVTGVELRGQSDSVRLVGFSPSGKWIATFAGESIRIWEAETGRTVQAIEADGGVTTDLHWLPTCDLLALSTQGGRVRIWGTADDAKSVALQPLDLPVFEPVVVDPESKRPANWAQLKQVMDLSSFPKLPGAVPEYGMTNREYYSANCSLSEARQFYRYYLDKAGWTEVENTTNEEGLLFNKDNCQLKVGLSQSAGGVSPDDNSLKVELFFAGNYKLSWLPKYSEFEANSSHEFISSCGYQVKADITDLEVALLKAYHDAGWIAYTRLAVSTSEDQPESRSLDFVQGASELSAFIGPVANTPDLISVQTSVSSLNKSIPLPSDVSWVECDFSTDLKLAAKTKLGLEATRSFYDQQMPTEGWMPRDDGRGERDGQAWLPFIRGQQDVTIRLVSSEDGTTRIFAGEGEQWQHRTEEVKVDPELAANGIEAADFPVSKDAENVQYSASEERMTWKQPATKPPAAVELLDAGLAGLDWVREDGGVISDEYVFVSYKKGEATIEFRATLRENSFSDIIVSGDGLLWQKPLPVAPRRISYETWMTRNRLDYSLDHLDRFVSEVRSIPIIRAD